MSILRSVGPVVAQVSPQEAIRAGFGAFVGLFVTGLFVLSPHVDMTTGLYLVAPFGATSVLLFAIPNSPLAQPWSAVIGNTAAALVGVATCILVPDATLRIPIAVGVAIAVTMLCRAVHPPAGAVAMTAAMSPDAVAHLGFLFALFPIATGTLALVGIAAIYARLTGRRYPFRQFEEPNKHGTASPEPSERLGLSETELSEILERYRQSFNLGVEDLARLIGAAELQAAAHGVGPLTANDFMSKDLITVTPETGLPRVAELFREHRFTSLPVVGREAAFHGVIFQMHLIDWAGQDARNRGLSGAVALKRLFGRDTRRSVRAGDIMKTTGPRAFSDTPLAALLPMMANGDVDAVPVLEAGRIVGIVTRTDIIAAMARQLVRKNTVS